MHRPIECEIVAATNKDLRAAVAAREFREDLYFRLSVFPIVIPPLRERSEDVPILARYFIDRFCKDLKKPGLGLSPEANEALRVYLWPGNVRELQNCIERAVILCETADIQPRHLNLEADAVQGRISSPWDLMNLAGSLEEASSRIHGEFERHKLAQALRDARGDRELAAARLKITQRDLLTRLQRHHID